MNSAAAAPSPSRRARALARSVTATWWYTASSVIFLQVGTLAVWLVPAIVIDKPWPVLLGVVLYLAGTACSLVSAVALLIAYRRASASDETDHSWPPSPLVWIGLGTGLAATTLLGTASGSWLIAAGSAVFVLCLLRWPPGVRLRLLALGVAVLVVVWLVEGTPEAGRPEILMFPAFAIMLPVTAVLSMWWWDVVVELDRARAAESRLAAAQERLRLAGDLHDLQGHHLQVIALQLELAERMLPRDPDAALDQVRSARASVDAAREGTRDLAGRFRGVPLPDELANAADLLRAAGIAVRLEVAATAGEAPADVLGPIVRESTTNVLKHGGGGWAQLSLQHEADGWLLRIANDAGEGSALGSGAGLSGIAERVGAVGGSLRTHAGDDFEVVVTVPAGGGDTP